VTGVLGSIFKKIGEFTWRMPDCEELVVVTHRRNEEGRR